MQVFLSTNYFELDRDRGWKRTNACHMIRGKKERNESDLLRKKREELGEFLQADANL